MVFFIGGPPNSSSIIGFIYLLVLVLFPFLGGFLVEAIFGVTKNFCSFRAPLQCNTEEIHTHLAMEETMQRIEGLMLAAGYLPASVASIPPFDKINGGLSWLIHTSNADVDLDLFYNQQTNLQQKL